LCGYDGYHGALDLHHLDPHTKIRPKPTTVLGHIAELQKCVVLCANCHRQVHDPECNVAISHTSLLVLTPDELDCLSYKGIYTKGSHVIWSPMLGTTVEYKDYVVTASHKDAVSRAKKGISCPKKGIPSDKRGMPLTSAERVSKTRIQTPEDRAKKSISAIRDKRLRQMINDILPKCGRGS
jgi:hypothetical protein